MKNLNADNNNKVYALVVLFGFETKNFFGSGLYEQLAKKNKVIILKRDFPSVNFSEYKEKYNLDVIDLITNKTKETNRLKIENLYLASRRARQRLNNIENFNYFKADRKRKFSDYILGNVITNKMLSLLAQFIIYKSYQDASLKKIFAEQGVTDLILAGYSSPLSISLGNTAKKFGCKVNLVINSWKDFYVNDLIPFKPSKSFVWSSQMKEQLLSSNSHVKDTDVVVSGNPSFDRFFNYLPDKSKLYYSEKYKFENTRPIILYSMISPQAFPNEKLTIELINQKLTSIYPEKSKRPIIILRVNPIDETVANEANFTNDNVRYADNYFEGSYAHAVFVQLNEGETEWLDLLYHAKININVSSTVTLESLMMNTPVINIEFDGSGLLNTQLSRYTNAPFYKPLLNREDVFIAKTLDECITGIKKFIFKDKGVCNVNPIIDSMDGQATNRMLSNF